MLLRQLEETWGSWIPQGFVFQHWSSTSACAQVAAILQNEDAEPPHHGKFCRTVLYWRIFSGLINC